MTADLRIDPDVVEDLARRALRIAEDLGGTGASGELLAFAEAAGAAARRARDADRDAADRFR